MDLQLRLQILRAAVRDRAFLKQAWRDVRPTDFENKEEALVAEAAITFYEKFEEPVGILLRAEVDSLIAKNGHTGAVLLQKLKDIIAQIQGAAMELVSVKALVAHVKALKQSSFYTEAVEEVITAHEKGELSSEVMAGIIERAHKELHSTQSIAHDFFSDTELEKRILRRASWEDSKYPLLLIQPLDSKIQIVGRGQLAIWIAPPSGGKGLALLHTACAYALQGLRVLFITLEDPLELVENRLDASLTGVPLTRLRHLPKRLRKRFRRARKQVHGKLHIVDGTDGGWTVSRVERLWEQEKQNGFIADAVIIDYDDELECEKSFKGESARRFEFAEIYKRLRRFAGRTNAIVWTAAQTTKGAVGRKLITSRDTAEDFSKIRKVFLAITIGKDPEEDNVKYLYIAKHRLDRMGFGVEIVSDYNSAVFYDGEETMTRAANTQPAEV